MTRPDCTCRPYHVLGCPAYGEDNRREPELPCPHDRVVPLYSGGVRCLDCAEAFPSAEHLDPKMRDAIRGER